MNNLNIDKAISSMETKIENMQNKRWAAIRGPQTPGVGRMMTDLMREDIQEFKQILDLAKAGKWTEVSTMGRGLDTAIRDGLPDAMWDLMDAFRS